MTTCREVDREWDRRLDAVRAGGPPVGADALPPELEAHLSRCPGCRSRAAGYAALAQAIGGLGPMPAPSGRLVARILADVEHDPAPRTVPIRRLPAVARWAGAAAAVAIVLLGVRAMRPLPGVVPGPPPPIPGPLAGATPRSLTEAVAEAAEATVSIARKTSEPAARLGRDVLAATSLTAPDLAAAGVEPPDPPVAEGAADRVVRRIGSSLEAGVRPLSQPTRSAFSFLVPSLPRADEAPPDDLGA